MHLNRRRITIAPFAALVAVTTTLLCSGAAHAAVTVQTHTVPESSAGLSSMVLGPDGNLWFGEANVGPDGAYHVASLSPSSGTFGPVIAAPVDPNDTDPDGFGPRDLVSSGGSIWFTNNIGDQIDRFVPGGSLVQSISDDENADPTSSLGPSDHGGVWATDQDGFDQPNGATDLRLYAANAGTGATPQFFAASYGATFFATPLVLGPNGDIFYSDDAAFLRETSDTGATQSFPISGIPLGAPNAMAFDGHGNLWFTSEDPGTEFTPPLDGGFGELPAGASSATASALPNDAIPTSIGRGPDGNMYFGWFDGDSNSPHGGIGQINTATGKVALADLGGFEPASVTFTRDGGLWFLDAGLNQVDRVDISQLFAAPPNPGGGGAPGGGTSPGGGAPGGGTPGGGNAGAGPKPLAAHVTLKAPKQTLRSVVEHGSLTVTCALAGAGRCAVKATIAAKTAKRLKLVKPTGHKRHGKAAASKPYTLTSAAKTFKHKGKAKLKLKLSAKRRFALAHVASLKLTLTATSTAAGHRARTTHKTITLR